MHVEALETRVGLGLVPRARCFCAGRRINIRSLLHGFVAAAGMLAEPMKFVHTTYSMTT